MLKILTKKQLAVLKLLAHGKSDKEIEEILKIKRSSVQTHVKAMMSNLLLFDKQGSKKNRVKAVTIYWKNNIEELQNLQIEDLV